jgi:hypothetical protein
MSRSYDPSATAETFDRGVLATKVAGLLSRPAGCSITDADRKDLTAAKELVEEMLSGARSLTGKSITESSARGIRSLGLALHPLSKLQHEPSDDFAQLLATIEKVLERLQCEQLLPTPDATITMAGAFFGLFADSVLTSVSRLRMSKERPPVL